MAITVTDPQAGRVFVGGEPLTVAWSTTDVNVAAFVVRLSTDNGATFNNVSGDLPSGARSFSFQLPVPPASAPFQAIARVASKDSAGNSISRGDSPVFEIRLAKVEVTAPLGGTFDPAQSITVSWQTTGPVFAHAVRISTDGGLTFSSVTAADLPGTARTFTFPLPSPAGSPIQAILRVAGKDASGQQIAKGDSPPLTVRPISVTVTNPNGGTFQAGQLLNVTWNTLGSVASHVVRLSQDGGATFTTISGTLAGGDRTFSFLLPSPATSSVQAVVRVVARDALGNTLANDDGLPFTLQQQIVQATQVTVTAPPANVSLQGGQALRVDWITDGAVTSHAVQISINGGVFTNVTTTDLASTVRTFTFNLPTPASQAQARVKVQAKGSGGVLLAEGISGQFTIQPISIATQVTVTAPPANVSVQGGQPLRVDWTVSGPVNLQTVQISINGGVFTNVTTTDLGGTVRTFTFILPTPATQAQARVKVQAKSTGGVLLAEGISGVFTIQPIPAVTQVTVTAPPANVTVQGGQPLRVDWAVSGPVTSQTVQISTNGGATYTNATTADLAGTLRTFTFNLPSPATPAQARIKVQAKGAGGVVVAEGFSGLFTIQPVAAGIQISPASGPPGSDVVISGLSTTVISAGFGSVLSPELLVEAAASVTVEIPEGAASGPITLTLPGGGTLTTPPFTVTAAPNKPTVTAINPACGSAGTAVKISGTNFVPGQTVVRFKKAGGRVKAANPAVDPSGTYLTCNVPTGTVTGKVKVTTPNGRDFSPEFMLEPAVVTLTLVGGSRIAVGRASRLLAQGDSLPMNEMAYRVVSAIADTPVPGVKVVLAERRPTYDEVPLPGPGATFFSGNEAAFTVLSKATDPPVMELLIQVDPGVPTGTYRLRAQVCTKVAFAPLEIAAATPRPVVTGLAPDPLLAPVILPDVIPDPSLAALRRLESTGQLAGLVARILPLLLLPDSRTLPPNPLGATPKKPVKRDGAVPSFTGVTVPAPLPLDADLDGDCLPQSFEQDLASAFVPSYISSSKEKAGTGFARFQPDQNIRKVVPTTETPASDPIVHYRVTRLGISRNGLDRFAVLQIDYFTLWTRDDGIPTLPNFVKSIADAVGIDSLKGHLNEEEHSAVLVGASLASGEANRYPTELNRYKAFEFFVTAHEGERFFDQTTYLRPLLPVAAGQHIKLFQALSKHGTYERNPDYFPLLPKAGQAALTLIAIGLGAVDPNEKIEVAAASGLAALAILFFFVVAVERFPRGSALAERRPTGTSRLVNVGEIEPGRQLNGALWIRETKDLTDGRDLRSKFETPLWTVDNPIVPGMADFVFAPQTGQPGSPVSIFGDGFADVTAVQFCNAPAASFTVVSPNLIRATVPPGAATGSILVTTSGTFRRSRNLFSVCEVKAPEISLFLPAEGAEGAQVEIVGENLAGATQVLFGGTQAPFVVNSPASITAFMPVRIAAGFPDQIMTITVRVGNLSASRSGYKVLAPKSPTDSFFQVSGFDPAIAPQGAEISIFGAELETVTTVRFGQVAAPATSAVRNLVKVKVPAGAEMAPLTVVRSLGTSREATSLGDFVPASAVDVPVIDRFTPTLGPAITNGGTQVRLFGLNLDNRSAVKIGGVAATVRSESPFSVTVELPVGKDGDQVPIFAPFQVIPVRGSSGPIASARNFVVTDKVDGRPPQPSIGSLSTFSGPVGSPVTLTGTNFNGVLTVLFGEFETCFRVDSPTTIVANVPPNFRLGPVTVVTAGGRAMTTQDFTVTSG